MSENPGEVLLSYETSRDLGLINVIRQITCESTEKIVSEFEDRFRDLGKLSDGNAHLHMEMKLSRANRIVMFAYHFYSESQSTRSYNSY